jgi:Flp pilus assembly protein TadD
MLPALAGCAAQPTPDAAADVAPLQGRLDEADQAAFARDYARLLGSAGRSGEALRILESLRKEQPDDADTLRLLARSYEQAGNLPMALVAWDELRSRNLAERRDVAEYARVALLNERFELADGIYREWLASAAPRSREAVMALNNLGYSQLLQGRPEEAARLLQQAVLMDPLHTRARSNLALARRLASNESREFAP